jgi:DNA phosphorothioation-associated putative methyltransferase
MRSREDIRLLHEHGIKCAGWDPYLAYQNFDDDPHPALIRGVKVALRTLEVSCYEYAMADNPPILHRKEVFLPSEHPLYDRFARLTKQEEKHGLLDETASIGTHNGWNARLIERGFELRGYRLVKRTNK